MRTSKKMLKHLDRCCIKRQENAAARKRGLDGEPKASGSAQQGAAPGQGVPFGDASARLNSAAGSRAAPGGYGLGHAPPAANVVAEAGTAACQQLLHGATTQPPLFPSGARPGGGTAAKPSVAAVVGSVSSLAPTRTHAVVGATPCPGLSSPHDAAARKRGLDGEPKASGSMQQGAVPGQRAPLGDAGARLNRAAGSRVAPGGYGLGHAPPASNAIAEPGTATHPQSLRGATVQPPLFPIGARPGGGTAAQPRPSIAAVAGSTSSLVPARTRAAVGVTPCPGLPSPPLSRTDGKRLRGVAGKVAKDLWQCTLSAEERALSAEERALSAEERALSAEERALCAEGEIGALHRKNDELQARVRELEEKMECLEAAHDVEVAQLEAERDSHADELAALEEMMERCKEASDETDAALREQLVASRADIDALMHFANEWVVTTKLGRGRGGGGGGGDGKPEVQIPSCRVYPGELGMAAALLAAAAGGMCSGVHFGCTLFLLLQGLTFACFGLNMVDCGCVGTPHTRSFATKGAGCRGLGSV